MISKKLEISYVVVDAWSYIQQNIVWDGLVVPVLGEAVYEELRQQYGREDNQPT